QVLERFTRGALLSGSVVVLLAKRFLQCEATLQPSSRRLPSISVVTPRYELGIPPPFVAVTPGQSHRCHGYLSYVYRHSPTAQTYESCGGLDHVLGLYPETAGISSQERCTSEDP